MYNPSIWDAENTQGRREYIVDLLLTNRGYNIHMKSIANIIDKMCGESNAMPDTTYAFHNSKYRRIITSDIDAINRDMGYHFVIATASDGAKLATKDDAYNEVRRLRRKALKTLAKASRIARKMKLDCQIDITGEEINNFIEEDNNE